MTNEQYKRMGKSRDDTDNYNQFCRDNKCDNYKEWQYYSTKLASCLLEGQTDNIIKIHKDCQFKNQLKRCKV